jgi:hypothetical protein
MKIYRKVKKKGRKKGIGRNRRRRQRKEETDLLFKWWLVTQACPPSLRVRKVISALTNYPTP